MVDLVNAPEAGDASEITKPEESIPEQYRGKSMEEVIRMHQEAEGLIDRQGGELGRLRKLAEEHVASVSSSEANGPTDFYEDPEKHIAEVIARQLAPVTETISAQREQAVRDRLDKEHPGWQETAGDKAFQDWVAESKVRIDLFVKANAAEYDAANELFQSYSAAKGSATASEEIADKAVKRDRKLRVPTCSSSAAPGCFATSR